jgi:hypothetical protein
MNMAKGSIKIFPKLDGGTAKKRSPSMLADYCWGLIREPPTGENKRQNKTK